MATTHKRFTKQQIQNWLINGDYNVTGVQVTDATGYLNRVIDYAVQHNPTAAYQHIQATYNNEFVKMLPGAENDPATQDSMINFLENKTALYSDAQRISYARVLLTLPTNPAVQNWTAPVNA